MNAEDEGRPLRSRVPSGATSQGARAAEAWQMLSGLLEAARVMPQQLRAPDRSLPLTILSGFLGAGKTTLLNRLLSDAGGRRIAVLVNDFGRINIDAALVASRTEDMISLTNGCACCTVATDLTRTLIELAQRADPPDALVLEASGLADPRGIAQVALTNPALRLDGVLTLVDALDFAEAHQAADLAGTVGCQLDAADLLLLTKTDAASPAQRDAARALLQQRHPGKPIAEVVHGELPVDVLLGVHTRREPQREAPAAWEHAAGFQSWSLRAPAPLDRGRLQAFLARVAPRLLRAEGVLWLAQDSERRHVYQQVGQRMSWAADAPWGAQAPGSTLVLIGAQGGFDEGQLQREFVGLAAPARVFEPPA